MSDFILSLPHMSLPFYLAGERIASDTTLDIMFPYDQSVIETVAVAQPEHVEKAISLAHESLAETKKLEPYQRAQVLRYIAQQLEKRHEEFSQLLAKENGKTIKEARGEMTRCVSTYEMAA